MSKYLYIKLVTKQAHKQMFNHGNNQNNNTPKKNKK
jgi:hypothetical protein